MRNPAFSGSYVEESALDRREATFVCLEAGMDLIRGENSNFVDDLKEAFNRHAEILSPHTSSGFPFVLYKTLSSVFGFDDRRFAISFDAAREMIPNDDHAVILRGLGIPRLSTERFGTEGQTDLEVQYVAQNYSYGGRYFVYQYAKDNDGVEYHHFQAFNARGECEGLPVTISMPADRVTGTIRLLVSRFDFASIYRNSSQRITTIAIPRFRLADCY